MGVSVSGFDALISALEQSPDRLQRDIVIRADKIAERIAAQAREGAPVQNGQLRNSLKSYVEVHGDQVEGGVKTDYAPAIYHEFGTGPVGDENPRPQAGELGISHRPDGWVYQSEEAAAMRGEEYVENEKGGYVYTEGVPAKAFMHNALTANEDAILESLGGALEEVLIK
ncbi:MAG: HK97 gp10 family phage protein [Clostridiales bacterium]|nr:HK97 gp10 family phage protein [Clostridiales bacterium]